MTLARRTWSQLETRNLLILAIVGLALAIAHFVFGLPLGGLVLFAGPVTLAQASLNAADDIDRLVIDEFRKSSWLFDNITFHDVVAPGGSGTLVYGYQRLVTQPTAAFRAINAEYTPQEATKVEIVVSPKPFGGSFQIDRVLDAVAAGAETAFQMEQKAKAAKALFNDAVINGDSGVDANSFDGLSKALTGTATEITAAEWAANGVTGLWHGTFDEPKAQTIMDDIDILLAQLDGPADAIMANKAVLAKLRGAARRAGYFTRSETAFGTFIEAYNGIVLIDPGKKPGSEVDVIPVTGAGPTDIYAFRLGMDGLHAISLAGQPPVRQWLPDFTQAGAVKTGEVEMVAAIALKATKAAAVVRAVDLIA